MAGRVLGGDMGGVGRAVCLKRGGMERVSVERSGGLGRVVLLPERVSEAGELVENEGRGRLGVESTL